MVTPKLITVGHILKEYIRFPDREIGPVLGSPAAYSAVAASRLGMETGIVTRVGNDMPSQLIQPIIDAGVDVRGITNKGKSTTTTILAYDISGNKKITYEKIAPDITFEGIPQEFLLAKAALICPMNFEVPLDTVRTLHEHDLLMMADLGGFGGTVSVVHPRSKGIEEHRFLRELFNYCKFIKASLEDCQYLFGSVDGPEEAGRLMAKIGVQVAIVTLGSEGSILFEDNNRYEIPVFPATVVDTTGAGDVFCGSFLVEYLRTKDVRKAGFFASATSSIMIESSGGVLASRMPTTEQVTRKLFESPHKFE